MINHARHADLDALEHDFELLETAGTFVSTAMLGIPQRKIEQTILDWAKGHIEYEPDEQQSAAIMSMAAEVCLYQPSMSGSTPLDRFLRDIETNDVLSRQACRALAGAQLRLVKILGRLDPDLVELEDSISGTRLVLINSHYSEASEGFEALMRLCQLESGRFILISSSFLLSKSLREVVDGYIKRGKGIANPYRCMCTVYKQAVREGVLPTPELDVEDALTEDNMQIMAMAIVLEDDWSEAKKDPVLFAEFANDLRQEASATFLLDCLQIHSIALGGQVPVSAEIFVEICAIVAETLMRQQRFGLVRADAQIEWLRQQMPSLVRDGILLKASAELLDRLIDTHAYGAKSETPLDADLAKVIQRIRALQAKTTDQGCTEEEAISAASKAAELLDRYGIELTETSMREIGCEAVRYDTGRKRRNDTDALCTVVSSFFDCRGWLTKTADGEIQHVVFGFKADAEAAILLIGRIYAIVEQATAQFKQGDIYKAMTGARKRTASASFQTGMVGGITQKLNKLKQDRLQSAGRSAGTSLTVAKDQMVRGEMEKLGLGMRVLAKGQSRIHRQSFHAGQQTGLMFSPDDQLE